MQSRMQQIGRYEIERELGRGAMGVVYLARDTRLGRAVALKTIRLSDFADSDKLERLRKRLIREAQSAGSLTHENIVTIYDVEEQDDISYISMEFVDGESLERIMEQRRELSRDAVLSLLRQMASGLDFAHSRGIIHRDVKPPNVMVNRLGRLKVTDFGVAKVMDASSMTQGGTMLGTPDYMSPEQIDGRSVDGRADQFSLAVIAFELLTGERPFIADSLAALFYRIAHESTPDAALLNPSLSTEIAEILRKAMAKKPEQRFTTCMGFVDSLTAACNRVPGWHALPRGMSQTLPTANEAFTEGNVATAGGHRMPPPAAAPPVPKPAPRVVLPPLGSGSPPPEAGFITGATAGTSTQRSSISSDDWLAHLEEEERTTRSRRRNGIIFGVLSTLFLGGAIAVAYQWLGKGAQIVPAPGETVESAQSQPPDTPSTSSDASGVGGSAADSPISGDSVPEETTADNADATADAGASTTSTDGPDASNEAAANVTTSPVTKPAAQPTPVAKPAEVKTPAATPAKPVTRPVSPPRERMTTVRFMSEPPGARVTVDADADLSCETPCSLELPVGRHTYSARRSGFRNEIRLVEVGNYGSTVNINLKGVTGMVRVTSRPMGATVSVNGDRQNGTTPMTLRLAPGAYRIVIERDGRRVEKSVTVREDALLDLVADIPE